MTGPLLDRSAILAAFALLDRRLATRQVHADVYVVGGAAMALAWDARRTTRDVDGLFHTDHHQALLEEIWAVADDMDLPRSWMNEQATMYAPTDYRSEAGTVYDGSHLRVMTTSARIVLAMKTAAMRPSDFEDIFVLMAQLDLTTADEVVAVHDEVFAGAPLSTDRAVALSAVIEASTAISDS